MCLLLWLVTVTSAPQWSIYMPMPRSCGLRWSWFDFRSQETDGGRTVEAPRHRCRRGNSSLGGLVLVQEVKNDADAD